MRKGKSCFFIVPLIFLILLISSCTKEQVVSVKGLKVGYSVQDLSNSYFQVLSNGMKDRCRELDIELTVVNATMDPKKQESDLFAMVEDEYDIIICSPVDPISCIAPLTAAKKAGIPFINPNQTIPGSDAHINLDDYEYGRLGGKIAGRWIVEHFSQPVNVLIIGFDKIQELSLRSNGIKDAILEMAPDTIIVGTVSALTPHTGMVECDKALAYYENIQVIAAVNDAAALGATTAVLSKGDIPPNFCIVGLDATSDSLEMMQQENSIFRGTVDINPYETGIVTINTAMEVFINGPIKEVIPIPMTPIYWDTGNK
jgi:ribose transport system substrate-binding protein